MSALDWGNVPAYFGGIALLFTALTIWRDRLANQRKQAEAIAAWIRKNNKELSLVIRNDSNLPVTYVRVTLIYYVIRGERSSIRRIAGFREVLPPDTTDQVGSLDIDDPTSVLASPFSVISFIDAGGRAWARFMNKYYQVPSLWHFLDAFSRIALDTRKQTGRLRVFFLLDKMHAQLAGRLREQPRPEG